MLSGPVMVIFKIRNYLKGLVIFEEKTIVLLLLSSSSSLDLLFFSGLFFHL